MFEKFFSKGNTNTITINGKSTVVTGNNITINNGKVIVDGVVTEDGLSGIVEIKFEGDLANVKSTSSVTVHGNVHGSADAGSHISCQDIGGNADAGSHINCRDIHGDADAGSRISCNSHGGRR